MKNLIFVFISTFFYAQEKNTSIINISVGVATTNETNNLVDDILTGIFTNQSFKNERVSPSFNVTYKYAVLDNLFLNLNGSLQSIKRDVLESNDVVGNLTNNYMTIGTGADYHYIKKEWFQMYSGISVAYTFQNSDFVPNGKISTMNSMDKKNKFLNYQFNAIGISFGKRIAGHIEIGFGYKGIINAGLSHTFK